jgi:hypothetical protein
MSQSMASAALTNYRDAAPAPIAAVGQSAQVLNVQEAAKPDFIDKWSRLASLASEPNPFLEPWYLLPSIENFAGGKAVHIFALYDGPELTGLAPLQSSNLYYKYPIPHQANFTHYNMFCGAPLVAKGCEQDFWRALLGHLDSKAGAALFYHLTALPAGGRVASALEQVCAGEDRMAAVVQSSERAMLRSDLSAEEYFNASLKNKRRKEMRRQKRRLEELGELTFTREDEPSGTAQWTQEFLALEEAGWKGEQGSALSNAGATRDLFVSAMQGAADAGRLERLTLRLDTKPIAMLANFITAPGSFSFKTAFDEEYYKFSPGVLLQQENLALLERDDVKWCDSCAASGHPMIEHIWREKRRMISVSIAIGSPLRRTLFAALLRAETHTPLSSDIRENCS